MPVSAKTISHLTFVAATLFFGFVALQQRQRLRTLEEAATQAVMDRDALKKHADERERLLTAAEQDRDAAQTALKSARSRPAPAAVDRTRDPAAVGMAMLDNPAMQKIMAASIKGTLDQRYGSLFRLLKLSPGDLEKLKQLLIEKQMSGLDVMRAAQTQGLNPATNSKELGQLMGKVQGELDGNINTLLGDAGFQQYQDFNRNAGSYAILDQVDRRLGYTNAPLTPAQSDALLHVLADTTKSSFPGGSPGGANMASFVQGFAGSNPMIAAMVQPHITDETINSAQGVLSAPQIEVLKQLQAEQKDQLTSLQSLGAGAGKMTVPESGAATISIQTLPVPIPAEPGHP